MTNHMTAPQSLEKETPMIDNQITSALLAEDIRAAWKYATRAVNCCENAGLHETWQAMAGIVVELSQQLEYIETELQSVRIAERREERERQENYTPAAEQMVMEAVAAERRRVAEVLSRIVISEGDDAGVILLSDESPTDWSEEHKCHVYRHEHFSPLGDALVQLARSVSPKGE